MSETTVTFWRCGTCGRVDYADPPAVEACCGKPRDIIVIPIRSENVEWILEMAAQERTQRWQRNRLARARVPESSEGGRSDNG